MQAPDEIDGIIAKAIFDEMDISDSLALPESFRYAAAVVAALKSAGYRIELDQEFLLRKGADEGVVLK